MVDRDRLIELVCKGIQEFGRSTVKCSADEYIADHLLANGVIVPPCKVGDTVYIERICGHKEDSSPIFKLEQGRVYKIEVDDTIWVAADFGILNCCRPYTDFYFNKEEAESKLKELNGECH